MVYSKFQSDVKSGKTTWYCFSEKKHVYSPLKVITVKKITMTASTEKISELDPGYDLKGIRCILDGKRLYFDKKASYQLGGKIVGNCLDSHRIEQVIMARVVNEPDCKEIIQVKIKSSKY